MSPVERIYFPLRWEFIPVRTRHDRAIHWKWRAFSHWGSLAMESKVSFETLTECREDAKTYGYQIPEWR